MAKKVNGELQVEVNHVVNNFGTKTVTTLKREDVLMASDGEKLKEDSEEATKDQKELPEHPATVSVGKKLTINLGDFQSAQVSVHLSMPCHPDKDHINKMYKKVNKWVDARVIEERDSVRNAQM